MKVVTLDNLSRFLGTLTASLCDVTEALHPGFAAALAVARRWEAKASKASAANLAKDDTSLVFAPRLDFSATTNLRGLYWGCRSLAHVPDMDTRSAADLSLAFARCSSLKEAPAFTTASATSLYGLFNACSALESAPVLDLSCCTSVSALCNGCASLRVLHLENLGAVSGCTATEAPFNFPWGTGSDEARQSLADSLLAHSFDRAAAGHPAMTITLQAASKALLTQQELAAITAKGFTIA